MASNLTVHTLSVGWSTIGKQIPLYILFSPVVFSPTHREWVIFTPFRVFIMIFKIFDSGIQYKLYIHDIAIFGQYLALSFFDLKLPFSC